MFVDKIEQSLEESESIQVEITELEHYLLGPEDVDICIKSFAESAREERGGRKVALLDTGGVNRTPTHTARTDVHSASAHRTAHTAHFSSREHAWLKRWCAQNSLSSTCHVSFFAAT